MKQDGFSLLEVIIVMLLLMIGSFGLNASTRYVEETKFKVLVKQVEKGIKSAQYMASITGREYNVYCGEKTVYIILNARDSRKAVYMFEMDKNISIPRNITGKSITFSGGMAPSKGGTIEFINTALAKRARITVRIATGKTTIYFE